MYKGHVEELVNRGSLFLSSAHKFKRDNTNSSYNKNTYPYRKIKSPMHKICIDHSGDNVDDLNDKKYNSNGARVQFLVL